MTSEQHKYTPEHTAFSIHIALSSEQLKIPLSSLLLSIEQKKLLKKLGSMIDISCVHDIIELDQEYLATLPTMGTVYVNKLMEFKEQIAHCLDRVSEKKALCESSEPLDLKVIDSLLVANIKAYLSTCDQTKVKIATSIWGFGCKAKTLSEMSSHYVLTRERIRQISNSIINGLSDFLTIDKDILWAAINGNISEDLITLLPELAVCFNHNEKRLCDFIERCCQVKKGTIKHKKQVIIPNQTVVHLFCKQIPPDTEQELIDSLIAEHDYNQVAARNGVKRLIKIGKLSVYEGRLRPHKLGRIEALEHTLTRYPDGLPWKSVIQLSNQNNCSAVKIDESRLTLSFIDSNFLYLCGKGRYKHVLYANLADYNMNIIMQHLLDYFKENALTDIHLNDYYFKARAELNGLDYFILRHFVRGYGENYGLYFNGQSGVDNVSIHSSTNRVTQADLIIKVLNEAGSPLTSKDIAERLVSKSINHAGFYLHKLIAENKVIRVDQRHYSTPEKAFRELNMPAILDALKDIMNTHNTIIEAGYFCERVNERLNTHLNRYLCNDIIRTYLDDLGWYRGNTLYSKSPLRFCNMMDIVKALCVTGLSIKENVDIIKSSVLVSPLSAYSAVQQWGRNQSKA